MRLPLKNFAFHFLIKLSYRLDGVLSRAGIGGCTSLIIPKKCPTRKRFRVGHFNSEHTHKELLASASGLTQLSILFARDADPLSATPLAIESTCSPLFDDARGSLRRAAGRRSTMWVLLQKGSYTRPRRFHHCPDKTPRRVFRDAVDSSRSHASYHQRQK
jgi:hypothetical protein